MKKLITLSAFIAFGFSANAQDYKPTKGTVTTEVSLGNGSSINNFELQQITEVTKPSLKFRYFLKDDVALRLGFSATREVKKSTPETTIDVTGVLAPASPPILTTSFSSQSFFGLNLGIEKHFKGSDRLSTYVGADILIGTSRNFTEVTNSANGNFISTKNENSGPPNPKEANVSFGLGLLTGADYYIAKKVYLGVEVGLAMVSKSKKDTIDTAVVGAITTVKTTKDADGNFNIDTKLNGGIRIGYQF